MDRQAALIELNSFFVWELQKGGIGFLSASKPKGDCECYAATLLLLLCDGSKKRLQKMLKRGDAEFVRCWLPDGQAHAVLRLRDGWCADNVQRRWVQDWALLEAAGYRFREVRPWREVIRRIKMGQRPSFLDKLLCWLPLPL